MAPPKMKGYYMMKPRKSTVAAVIIAALLLTCLFPITAFAAEKNLITDQISVLSSSERAELNDYAAEIGNNYGMDIAILLASPSYKADKKTLSEYAEECYLSVNKLGPNGFILAHDEENDVWGFVYFGSAESLLTEAAIEQFFAAYDSEDTYYEGIVAYLDAADRHLARVSVNSSNLIRISSPGERLPRFVDDENLLTAKQAADLTAKLDEISERQQFDTVVVVVSALDSREARLYAIDFFEQNGFGFGDKRDGAILLLATRDRDFGFASTGFGLTVFTPAGQDYLDKLFLPDLKKDNYYEAFMAYAEAVDDFVSQAKAGTPYDEGNIPLTASEKSQYRTYGVIASLVLAFIIAGLVTSVWKAQLVSVRKENFARAYIREGSMVLENQDDIFLYKNVVKSARASSSSSGSSGGSSFSSSSGSSSTGHSGKY